MSSRARARHVVAGRRATAGHRPAAARRRKLWGREAVDADRGQPLWIVDHQLCPAGSVARRRLPGANSDARSRPGSRGRGSSNRGGRVRASGLAAERPGPGDLRRVARCWLDRDLEGRAPVPCSSLACGSSSGRGVEDAGTRRDGTGAGEARAPEWRGRGCSLGSARGRLVPPVLDGTGERGDQRRHPQDDREQQQCAANVHGPHARRQCACRCGGQAPRGAADTTQWMPPPSRTSTRRRWPLVGVRSSSSRSSQRVPPPRRPRQDSLVPGVRGPSLADRAAARLRHQRAAGPQRSLRRCPAVQKARAEHPELEGHRRRSPPSGERAQRSRCCSTTPGEESQYGSDIRVEVVVSGLTGDVFEVWTGPQAGTPLARGEEPSVGQVAQRALRLASARGDLPRAPSSIRAGRCACCTSTSLVLLAFGLSQLYFNQGRIDVSMPLVYPLLAYLLVRMLLAGFRPRERSERLVPRLPVRWMAIGLVLLVAFRVGLNLADSNVIDVGYASVVGADRIVHGEELYVAQRRPRRHLRTGELPGLRAVRVAASHGTAAWDSVPAAHAAAISLRPAHDRRADAARDDAAPGPRRAPARARARASPGRPTRSRCWRSRRTRTTSWWPPCSCCALAALRSPPGRGALLGLAAAAKFAPLALAPLLARAAPARRGRRPASGIRPRLARRSAWP